MIVHVIYISFIILMSILSILILGPGSVLMFAFLIGIITIPLAFLIGIIPLVGLTLALSLPFYLGLAFIWPARPAKVILGSLALALLLSAGTSLAARIYLANASQQLISSDFTETIDIHQKHVVVANVHRANDCDHFCKELFKTGKARAVTLSEQSYEMALAGDFPGITFGRIANDQNDCAADNIVKHNNSEMGVCIGEIDAANAAPALLISANSKVLQFQEDDSWSFNPFEMAITAERVLAFDLSTSSPVLKVQQTSVKYFPPVPVLWPIAIGKGPHSSSQRGLFRQTVEVKSTPDLITQFFASN